MIRTLATEYTFIRHIPVRAGNRQPQEAHAMTSEGASGICGLPKCRAAPGRAMKRTGIMVLLSSCSPSGNESFQNPPQATGAAPGDPRRGEIPMEPVRPAVW